MLQDLQHRTNKKVQFLCEEFDSEQVELLLGLADWKKQMTRGESIAFALELGLLKSSFSEQEARSYIKSLIHRLRIERGY